VKVGLIDVDGHNFPNLALMKLSAWHKSQGDSVEWTIPILTYDRIYISKVFGFTPDFETAINAQKVIRGGSGYFKDKCDYEYHRERERYHGKYNVPYKDGVLQLELPNEIDEMYPDYSLYDITDTAYGYLTRGCPRGCGFCIVGQKEGLKSYKVADLKQFWNGQRKIKLLDPNLLACKDRMELLDQLIESGAWIDFTQGLDIRLMDYYITEKIKQMKVDVIHFAWDKMKDSQQIVKNLHIFKTITDFGYRKLKVYVLTNFDTTFEEDLYRIYTLKELGYDPYVMIYDKQNAPKQIRHLQRWVNNKKAFRVCERFEDFDIKLA
jgi:hypothetical protein